MVWTVMKVTPRFTPERPSFAMVWTTIATALFPVTESDDDDDGFVECRIDIGGWDGAITSGFTNMLSDDCDDSESDAYPGAAFNEADINACMIDVDGDGYGDLGASGGITAGTDCDDNDTTGASIYPYAAESAGDSVDSNCDGLENAGIECNGSWHTDGGGSDPYLLACEQQGTFSAVEANCLGHGYV